MLQSVDKSNQDVTFCKSAKLPEERENKTGEKQEEKPIASHIELYIKRWATL